MTTVAINNAKQGLTRVPTYAELIKEIDKEKFKTKEIRDVFDRNAWYFHESPLGGVLRDGVSNMPPADLQQQNFKNMVNQATRAEEGTKFYDMDDGMGEMREEAIDDFEMAFDKEKAMREESSRRVAEQVKLSHSHDHYKANQGTYDSIKAKPSSSSSTQTQQPSSSSTQTQTQSFSAGIPPQSSGSYYSGSFIPHKPEEEQSFSAGIPPEEDETKSKHSVLKSALKHSKPIIKKVAQVVGQAKGGDIGGMVAEKLADYVVPDLDTDTKPKKVGVKKSINKPEPKPFKPSEKKPKVSMDVDVQENPEMLNPKVKRPATSDRRTKVKIQKPDTTRPQAEKRPTDSTEGTTKTKTKRTKEPIPKKKTMKAITTDKKTLPAITVSGEPSRPSASSSASSSAPPPPKGKPQSYSPPKPEPAPAPKAEPKPPPPPEPKAKPKPKAETKPKPKPKAEPAKPSSSTASSSSAKPPDKEVKKETTKKKPSHTVSTEPTDTISMQVMLTTLMAERDKKIDKADWNEFDQVYKTWKKTRRDDQVVKKAKLEEARKIYRKLYKKISG